MNKKGFLPADTSSAQSDAAGEPDGFSQLLRDAAQVSRPRVTGAGFASQTTLASGRFTIRRRIGEGGMGVVYEAFDHERGRHVALKTLNRLDPTSVYQLKNEFRALAHVRHPNLVGLHELFADDGRWFFTMDFVDAVRFDVWVRSEAQAPPDAARVESRLRDLLPQLLAAISMIHAAGKLHRDLKPANVLVTQRGRVVVLDFGLAVDPEIGGVGQSVADFHIVGTPSYMAPEQAAGLPASQASDLYALGVMLFEALTGRLPFEGSVHDVLVDKQRLTAPAPSSLTPDVATDLDRLCIALLARDPACRPSLPELLEILGTPAMRESVPPLPTPTRAPEHPELFGRDAELEMLREAFELSCRGSKPVLLLLAGESGIGKSTLVEALLTDLRRDERALVLSGRCFERESVPFKAFDAVVDALSRHLRRLTNTQVSALLPRDVFALRTLFPVLSRIPAIEAAPSREIPDGHEQRRRAFLAFGELLARIRDRQPLVVHIDDLQWSDADSTTLLMQLLRQPDAPPLLIIASHRNEQMHAHPYLTPLYEELTAAPRLELRRLQLGPLPSDAAKLLLKRHFAEPPQNLVDEAAANPFLLKELAYYAAAYGNPLQDVSLRSLITIRTAALPADARRLLELLAVAAKPVPLTLASEAALTRGAPRAAFEVLRAEHLARATGAGSHVECYHDKVRAALIEGMTLQQQRDHHAALAGALAATPNPDAEELAAHLLAAGELQRAAEQFARAAERASRALGFDRAARLYAEAIRHGVFDPESTRVLRVAHAEALSHAGQGVGAAEAYLAARAGATDEHANELTQKAALNYLLCGQLRPGRALLEEALRPHGIGMPRTQRQVFVSLSWNRGRMLIDPLAFARRAEPSPGTQRALEVLRNVTFCFLRSDQVRATDFSARNVLAALRAGNAVELARALSFELTLSGLIGSPPKFAERVRALAEKLCVETGDPLARQYLCIAEGAYCMWALGDIERALEHMALYHELSRAHPYPTMFYDHRWVQFHEAAGLCLLGKLRESMRIWEAIRDEAWEKSDLTVGSGCAMLACMTLPAFGESDRASYELERAGRAWQTEDVTVQEAMLVAASLMVPSYAGDSRSAWEATQAKRDRIRGALFGRVPIGKLADAWSCGVAAAAAASSRDSAARRAALREVERCSKRMHGVWLLQAPPVNAAVECARGNLDRAVASLRSMLRDPKLAPLFAHAARRRLGELIGGDEGRTSIATADAFFTAAGVVDPQRYVAMLLPGVEEATDARPSGGVRGGRT